MRVRRCWLLWMLALGLLGLPAAGHAGPGPASSPLPAGEPAGRTASAPAVAVPGQVAVGADSPVRPAGDPSALVSSYRLATGPSAIRSLAASDPETEFGPERDPRFDRDGFSDQPNLPKGKKKPRPTADIVAVLLAAIIAALLVCRKSS